MNGSATQAHYFDFGKFRLDVSNRELLKDGNRIAITRKSFEILSYLIRNRGRMLKKQELLKVVWEESFVEEATLAQHIYMVRKALRDNGSTVVYIETIPKFGYRFKGDVNEVLVDLPQPLNRSADRLAPDETGLVPSAKQEQLWGPASGAAKEYRGSSFIRVFRTIPVYATATLLSVVLFALAAIAGLSLFGGQTGKTGPTKIRSISILPFEQIGGDGSEQLGLGLADAIISRLGNQDKISISPTTLIARFDRNVDDPVAIGKSLAVDAVLTGTIQRDNGIARVNAQLIDVRSGVPIWAGKFDAEFAGVFSFQDEVSDQLLRALAKKLGDLPNIAFSNRYTRNIEAYQSYVKGVALWNKRSPADLPKAIEELEKAIKLDPGFSSAYALAADAYSLVAYNRIDFVPPAKAIEKSREMASRALELEPKSSEALTALAIVALYEKKPDEAVRLYKKAIRINPNNATAHQRLAWMLATKEDLSSAIREMRLAQKADPESRLININLARLLRLNRQTDEALAYCRKAIALDRSKTWTRLILAEIYEQQGLLDKSIAELRSVPSNVPEEKTAKLLLSRVYAKKGDKAEARKLLDDIVARGDPEKPSYELATIYAVLGDKDEAVKELQAASEDTLIHYLHVKYDYNLDSLRATPEYPGILTKSKQKFLKVYDGDS